MKNLTSKDIENGMTIADLTNSFKEYYCKNNVIVAVECRGGDDIFVQFNNNEEFIVPKCDINFFKTNTVGFAKTAYRLYV